jgi:hypothetical protein
MKAAVFKKLANHFGGERPWQTRYRTLQNW